MKVDGTTKIYGIFGWPVSHTLSPALHNAAFQHIDMNACYIPFHVPPRDLAMAVDGIRGMNISGVNVTVPHKVEIIDYLDEVHGVARELNAVNVVVNTEGILSGYNTDVSGFMMSLEHAGVEVSEQHAIVLGAGGASRSVIKALQRSGVASIALFNRTVEKAEAIAEEFSGRGAPVDVWRFSDPEVDTLFESSMILVNSTSLGLRKKDPLPVEQRFLKKHHVVVDIIYHPWETPLLATGREIGALTINGYGMLVFQALEAFRLWTGKKPPLKVMWDAGLEEN